MRRLPPLSGIEAFLETARLGSVKAAAEALAPSGPAVTRRVQSLERFLGRSLFERRHQALSLNADGERLLADAAPLVEELALAVERAGGAGHDIMRLRLAVAPLFASQRLMPHMAQLRLRHPDLHIDIDTGAHAIPRLEDGLDAAIALASDVEPHLYSRKMAADQVVAIASRSLRDSLGPDPDPSQLAGVTVFVHRNLPDAWSYWSEAVGYPQLQPAAIDHFDSGQLILDAVAQGLGVALMLDSHLKEAQDNRLVQLFETTVDSPYNYWFVCRRSALSRKPVRIFHGWLFDEFMAAADALPPPVEAVIPAIALRA